MTWTYARCSSLYTYQSLCLALLCMVLVCCFALVFHPVLVLSMCFPLGQDNRQGRTPRRQQRTTTRTTIVDYPNEDIASWKNWKRQRGARGSGRRD